MQPSQPVYNVKYRMADPNPRPTKRKKSPVGSTSHLQNPGLVSQEEVDRYIEENHGLVIGNMVGCTVFTPVAQDPRKEVGTESLENLLRLATQRLDSSYNRTGFGSPLGLRMYNGPQIVVVNGGRVNIPGCRRPDEVLFSSHILAARVAETTGIALDTVNTRITNRHGVSYTGRTLDLPVIQRYLRCRRTNRINHLCYHAKFGDHVLTTLLHHTGAIVVCGSCDIRVLEGGLVDLLAFLAHFAGARAEPENPKLFRELINETS